MHDRQSGAGAAPQARPREGVAQRGRQWTGCHWDYDWDRPAGWHPQAGRQWDNEDHRHRILGSTCLVLSLRVSVTETFPGSDFV